MSHVNGNHLDRPDSEEQISLVVSGETDSGSWQEALEFDVSEREFEEEEIQKIDAYVADYADKMIKKSKGDKITLIEKVPDMGVSLNWTVPDEYLEGDGSVIAENIPDEGVDTEVMLSARWRNYKGEYHFPIHIDPQEIDPTVRAVMKARDDIARAIEEQPTARSIELPGEYEYGDEKEEKDYTPVYLIVGVIMFLPLLWRQQAGKKLDERNDQLITDHPAFVNKVMLLLGAGLNLRRTIERITAEYERELSEGGMRHYVYEELCITNEQLKSGVTEEQAIEDFGRRCKCMPYMKLSSIITQNIRKGSDGILNILEREVVNSLAERRAAALKKGEIAGTKLLMPMMVMLGLVMAMIMVPAFMTM